MPKNVNDSNSLFENSCINSETHHQRARIIAGVVGGGQTCRLNKTTPLKWAIHLDQHDVIEGFLLARPARLARLGNIFDFLEPA